MDIRKKSSYPKIRKCKLNDILYMQQTYRFPDNIKYGLQSLILFVSLYSWFIFRIYLFVYNSINFFDNNSAVWREGKYMAFKPRSKKKDVETNKSNTQKKKEQRTITRTCMNFTT